MAHRGLCYGAITEHFSGPDTAIGPVCVCVRTSQGATVRTVRTLFFSDNVHIQYAYFIPEGNVRSLLDVLDKVSTEH